MGTKIFLLHIKYKKMITSLFFHIHSSIPSLINIDSSYSMKFFTNYFFILILSVVVMATVFAAPIQGLQKREKQRGIAFKALDLWTAISPKINEVGANLIRKAADKGARIGQHVTKKGLKLAESTFSSGEKQDYQ